MSEPGSARPVRIFPDPGLKTPSAPVESFGGGTASTIADLLATMRGLSRCVGLAAPQIGVNQRIIAVNVAGHPKAPAAPRGLVVLVNPVIVARMGQLVSREGCVSLPDLTANVARAAYVAVNYLDGNGRSCALEAEAFEAVVLQHEIDHLDGLLFLDRVAASEVFKRKRYGAPDSKAG